MNVYSTLGFIATTLFLTTVSFSQPLEWKDGRYLASTKYGDVVVHVSSPVVYKTKDRPERIYNYVQVYRFQDRADYSSISSFVSAKITDGYFDFHGNVIKVELVPQDDNSLEIPSQLGELSPFTFKSAGPKTLTLKVGDERIDFRIDVVELELDTGAMLADFVFVYGNPKTRKHHNVFWPNTERIDEIIYSPKAGSMADVDHMTFDSLKYLTVSFSQSKLKELGVSALNSAELLMEEKQRIAKEMEQTEREKKEANKEADALVREVRGEIRFAIWGKNVAPSISSINRKALTQYRGVLEKLERSVKNGKVNTESKSNIAISKNGKIEFQNEEVRVIAADEIKALLAELPN